MLKVLKPVCSLFYFSLLAVMRMVHIPLVLQFHLFMVVLFFCCRNSLVVEAMHVDLILSQASVA